MEFISQHLVGVILASTISTLIFFYWMIRTHYLWMDVWYSLPVIGTISRSSKDTTRYARDNAWTNSERSLCHDYKQFFQLPTQDKFDQNIRYLQKSHDLGRSPLQVWFVGLLAMLVIAEGLGFSYLLGTWMAMEGSESTRQLLMFAIVFVLCVILMLVTHAAGHQLYRSNLLVGCNKEWRGAGQPGELAENVSLNMDQRCDDGMPSYRQCASRVAGAGGGEPSYSMVIIAGIVIAVIATASTWMRYQHLEAATIKETANLLQSVAPADAGNPFATGLPTEVTQVQSEADKKALKESGAATTSEGLAAFVMLGFIFVVTQIVGIFAGYKYGFAGKESKEAYRLTHGLSTYDGLMLRIDPIIQVARASLQRLQQKMTERHIGTGLKLGKTFDEYLMEPNNLGASLSKASDISSPTINTPQMVAAQPNPVVEQKISAAIPNIADHVAKVEAMGPGEDRQNYLASLTTDVLGAVQQMRKANKEAGAEDAKRRAELLKEDD